MSYDESLAQRLRVILKTQKDLQEKKMFSGLSFMINGKMCINVSGDKLMCRVDPQLTDELLKKEGVQPMVMRNRVYKGYIYVDQDIIKTNSDLMYWVNLCLEFNPLAKSSKK